jgi:CRISPR system Cascade subunit CasC
MTLIAIHILQNHAPSNLNRDDNGDPKDCLFGSVRRARISSQALKRSIRWAEQFRTAFADNLLANRTQLLPEEVRKRLSGYDIGGEARQAIIEAAEKFGKSDGGGGDTADENKPQRGRKGSDAANESAAQKVKTKQLMFLTAREIDQLTVELVERYQHDSASFAAIKWDKFREDRAEKYIPHAVDIAMFGRMTTSSPFKDVEAAVQVAHAFSTHAVEQEFDYYTAVDDISGEAGAGFIGETSFNSATYYKYINIHWEGLIANLQNDIKIASDTVRALIETAMFAIPSGKQNSFAAHNLPDLALIEVRDRNVPLSYANAFVQPVRATAQSSLVARSAEALQDYATMINGLYGLQARRAFISTVPFILPEAQQCASLPALLSWLPLPTGEQA